MAQISYSAREQRMPSNGLYGYHHPLALVVTRGPAEPFSY